MTKAVTLSTLFPDSARPQFGVFVERQTLALAAGGELEVETVAPVGIPPWPLSLHPRYRPLAALQEREVWKGLTVHRPRFRLLPGIGEARRARALARAVTPLVKSLKPDVLAADFFWPDGVAAMHVGAALGIAFSIKARGADIHYWGARPGIGGQLLEAARRADGLLAVSEALKRDMEALGMPGDKIRVHYTGIDHERFRPLERAAEKRKLGVTGPLLVTAGALIPRKAQKLTIAALAELPDATLLIVGDGPDRSELEALARPFGDRVRFLGSRPNDDLPRLYAAADAMVLPSSSEGLANVWVEAIACGTPVVIADVGGARELIDRPEAGRIVEREPGAIAAAVRELLVEPPEPEAVAKAAERFSWERNAAELSEFLREIAR